MIKKFWNWIMGRSKKLDDPKLLLSIGIVNTLKQIFDNKLWDAGTALLRTKNEIDDKLLGIIRLTIARTLSKLVLLKELTEKEVTEDSFKQIINQVIKLFPQIGEERAENLSILQARLFIRFKEY